MAELENIPDVKITIDIERIVRNAMFGASHGADSFHLGAGMIYLSLAYQKNAKLCVCLGSGGGFVPRCMRAGQRLGGVDGSTVLVDGNCGSWGRPNYLSPETFFRRVWPDIDVRIQTTEQAAEKFAEHGDKIDYLHIDADHTYKGSKYDFEMYTPLLSRDAIVTIHDTRMKHKRGQRNNLPKYGVYQTLADIRKMKDWEVIDLPIGNGLAIAKRIDD